MNIGFYGLGLMGSRMAKNVLKSGADVTVYNRTLSKAEPLKEHGAQIANTPEKLASHSEILFTMLSTPEVVEETALGENGFLDELKEDSLWVDCSTVNPSFSKRMAKESNDKNIRFLDAPVAGSTAPAENGELLFLVGGEKEDLEKCRPYLELMGKKVIHAGGNGKGTALKMVFNLLLGEAMTAFSEGVTLGESLGIDRKTLLDILPGSPVVAPFLSAKKDKIASDKYDVEFPLKWMQKDLHLAAKSGYETGAPLPLVNANKEVYAMAKREGMADEDFSAIFRFINGKDSN